MCTLINVFLLLLFFMLLSQFKCIHFVFMVAMNAKLWYISILLHLKWDELFIEFWSLQRSKIYMASFFFVPSSVCRSNFSFDMIFIVGTAAATATAENEASSSQPYYLLFCQWLRLLFFFLFCDLNNENIQRFSGSFAFMIVVWMLSFLVGNFLHMVLRKAVALSLCMGMCICVWCALSCRLCESMYCLATGDREIESIF